MTQREHVTHQEIAKRISEVKIDISKGPQNPAHSWIRRVDYSKHSIDADHGFFEGKKATPADIASGLPVHRPELERKIADSVNTYTVKAYALYSLMDHYSAADNFLNLLYSSPEYNVEHLIIHGNSQSNVTWIEEDNTFTFSLKELLDKVSERTYQANIYKKSSANYIILPVELNESLEQDDILQKSDAIKKYYEAPGRSIPKHITIFLTHIARTPGFSNLSALKGQKKSQDEIKDAYKIFVEAYFSEESQFNLYENIKVSFKDAFKNLG